MDPTPCVWGAMMMMLAMAMMAVAVVVVAMLVMVVFETCSLEHVLPPGAGVISALADGCE